MWIPAKSITESGRSRSVFGLLRIPHSKLGGDGERLTRRLRNRAATRPPVTVRVMRGRRRALENYEGQTGRRRLAYPGVRSRLENTPVSFKNVVAGPRLSVAPNSEFE